MEEDGHKMYYVNGEPVRDCYMQIKTKYYGFDENGYMMTGFVTIQGKPYAFSKSGAGMSKGWKSSKRYYCLGDGKLKVGYAKMLREKTKYYYFFDRATGILCKGYVYDVRKDKAYYFDTKYRGVEKGWIDVEDDKVYSTGNGKLASGYKKIGKKYYGFGTDGFMLTGLQKIGEKLYLFNNNGTGAKAKWFNENTMYCKGNGVVALGYKVIDGDGYFFEPNAEAENFGCMVFDPDSNMEINYKNKIYIIGTDGKGIDACWVDENRYCAGKGKLALGYAKAPDPATGKNYYWYFNKNAGDENFAHFMTGYIKDGKKHYLFNDNGHGVSKGWVKLNGSTKDNAYSTGKGILKTGWAAIDSKAYYFAKGTALQQKDKKVGYINIPAKGYLSEAYALGVKTLDKNGWSLMSAYTFSYKIRYQGRWFRTSSVEKYALKGFRYNYGNCYCMASTFVIQARLLGYNVRQVQGHVGALPHSWTEVKYKGSWKVFDPNFRNETGRSGWNIYYGKKGTWRYNRNVTPRYVPMSYQ